MKHLLIPIIICISTLTHAQVISEIMYNPPEDGADSLEYIEIYNNSDTAIDLSDYSLVGVNYIFDSIPLLEPDSFIVVCKNSAALFNNFGVNGYQWNSGALSNSGEEVGIINNVGDTVITVNYSSVGLWPFTTSIRGSSIELCDYNSDPQIPTNWNLSQGFTSVIINFARLTGSPGHPNLAVCQLRDYMSIAINEIMYESPDWDTELQYIELYNHGSETINLTSWCLEGDINIRSLTNVQIGPGDYYLIGNNPIGLFDYGLIMTGWGTTNKVSLDPNLTLKNPNGTPIVTLDIDEDRGFVNPQPGQAIELCDPVMDNNTSLNWNISTNPITMNGNAFSGTPGLNNTCMMIGTSSTSVNIDNEMISVYPNPSESQIKILSTQVIEEVHIYDQLGKVVQVERGKSTLQIDHLPKGRYHAMCYFKKGMAIKTFVKI